MVDNFLIIILNYIAKVIVIMMTITMLTWVGIHGDKSTGLYTGVLQTEETGL